MANYIALGFLAVGLFLIISMLWKDYADNQKMKQGFDQNYYRNGASGVIIIIIGVLCLIIAFFITVLN